MVTTGGKVVFGKYAQITNNPENDGCINAVLRMFLCRFTVRCDANRPIHQLYDSQLFLHDHTLYLLVDFMLY